MEVDNKFRDKYSTALVSSKARMKMTMRYYSSYLELLLYEDRRWGWRDGSMVKSIFVFTEAPTLFRAPWLLTRTCNPSSKGTSTASGLCRQAACMHTDPQSKA